MPMGSQNTISTIHLHRCKTVATVVALIWLFQVDYTIQIIGQNVNWYIFGSILISI